MAAVQIEEIHSFISKFHYLSKNGVNATLSFHTFDGNIGLSFNVDLGTARIQEATAYKNKGSHFNAARARRRRRREKARNSARNKDVSIPDPDRNANPSSHEKIVDNDESFTDVDNQTHELHSHGQSDLESSNGIHSEFYHEEVDPSVCSQSLHDLARE